MPKLTREQRKFPKKYRRDPEKHERQFKEAMAGLANLEAEMRKDPVMARQLDELIGRHERNKGET